MASKKKKPTQQSTPEPKKVEDPHKAQLRKLEEENDRLVEDQYEYEKIINIAIFHLMNGRSDKALKVLKPYQTVRKYDTDD